MACSDLATSTWTTMTAILGTLEIEFSRWASRRYPDHRRLGSSCSVRRHSRNSPSRLRFRSRQSGDNDPPPTKFYVVNDGSADRTYEYGASGTAGRELRPQQRQHRPARSGQHGGGRQGLGRRRQPKVYVYNTSGGLLGSWTAGTLASNATVEGIATNGTDVWIVDAKSDKVFKYTGAASRLSGSQNAASSFSLNSSNTNPKDIVTDGTSLVGRQRHHDRQGVQVHAVGLARRQLDDRPAAAPARPASRSIPPASATSGSSTAAPTASTSTTTPSAAPPARQAASTSFALAAGNTNPQGIADPPAGGAIADS